MNRGLRLVDAVMFAFYLVLAIARAFGSEYPAYRLSTRF